MDEAWQELESFGCELLYSCEDIVGHKQIYGYLDPQYLVDKFKSLSKIEKVEMEPIDWEAQWAAHGLDFHDGFVHVDLSKFGLKNPIRILRLKPGPGFGDLSHPTTRLMLKLMCGVAPKKHVIDIGSGSGILTLAALIFGAKKAYGIDIDESANFHAQSNAELNELEKRLFFGTPQNFELIKEEIPLCIVMNMIWSEQSVAWSSLPQLHRIESDIIISGILAEERQQYLTQTMKWGWQLLSELEEEGWLGFSFKQP